MNPTVSSHLSFSTSFWLVIFGLLVLVGAIGLGYWNWRRSAYQRSTGLLEILRLVIIGVIVFLLQEPEWVQIYHPTQKPKLQVLVDRSRSMQTIDAADAAVPGSPFRSRESLAERLLSLDAWTGLTDKFDVQIETFPTQTDSDRDASQGTDFSGVLKSTLAEASNLRSVVFVSDGDWNTGEPPSETAIAYRTLGIPIHTVGIGIEEKQPDLEMVDMDLATFGVVNKSIRIPFSISSSLGRTFAAQVHLEIDGEPVETKEVRLGAMSKVQESFTWTPTEIGDRRVKVYVTNFPDEVVTENNELTLSISIREERLKVLVIETYPRWEYRFLRNALSRDPGVEVSCLLLHPNLEKVGGGNRDYLSQFPESAEELAEYDVVFLGDIGLGAKQLTEAQCDLLRGLVEYQASGLVFLPGPYGNQATLAQSSLEPLIPVVPDSSHPNGIGDNSAMQFELTQAGKRSLLTKLTEQEDANVDVWSSLPGFQWYMPISRAKAGAETLAVHQQAMNDYGRLPLVVTKPFGVGKVLYMATDGAWRWRRGVEDLYHYRFWGQVVRWMAYQRHMNQGESFRFYYSPEVPNIGQKIALKVNAMSDSGEPISEGSVTVKMESPTGKVSMVQLKSAGQDSWGLFEGEFAPSETGKYRATISASGTEQIFEAELAVSGTKLEKVGEPAKPYVLEEISKISQGQFFSLNQLNHLQDIVLKMPEPPAFVKRTPIWAHPLVMLAIVGLLTLFWIGRKKVGLL